MRLRWSHEPGPAHINSFNPPFTDMQGEVTSQPSHSRDLNFGSIPHVSALNPYADPYAYPVVWE